MIKVTSNNLYKKLKWEGYKRRGLVDAKKHRHTTSAEKIRKASTEFISISGHMVVLSSAIFFHCPLHVFLALPPNTSASQDPLPGIVTQIFILKGPQLSCLFVVVVVVVAMHFSINLYCWPRSTKRRFSEAPWLPDRVLCASVV